MSITVALETGLTAEEYIWTLSQTDLGEKRPLANPDRVQAYLENSNIVVTARDDDGTLVGIFRGLTDWTWVCYCVDLAVLEDRQGQQIGRQLMDKAAEILGPGVAITLLSLPGAEGFYQKIGMQQPMAAYFRDRTDRT